MKQNNSAFYNVKGEIMNKRLIKELNLYFKTLNLSYYLIENKNQIRIVINK